LGTSLPLLAPPTTHSLFDAARRLGRTIQGGLPVVGLLSRLAAPGGGVGWDELAYPEFCRALADADTREAAAAAAAATAAGGGGASPPPSSSSPSPPMGPFAAALTDWAARHGRPGQARNVNLCLWMATSGGGGLVPGRTVLACARRLAVTADLEIEVERFAQARESALAGLKFGPRPAPSAAVQAALAVDALAVLTLGLRDGDAIADPADVAGLARLVPPALALGAAAAARAAPAGSVAAAAVGVDVAELEGLVRAAVESRGERASMYK
jgi:1,3-beta-glucan synthase